MPINKNDTHEEKVKELIDTYNENGKIGNTKPKNMKHALSIANAIAYQNESISSLNIRFNNLWSK